MAYTPISTMFNTPLSTTTVLSPLTPITVTEVQKPTLFSPLSPLSFSPFSTVTQSVVTNNNPLTIVTPIGPQIITTRPTYVVDIDTGMDDNYIVQRDVTRYFLYKTLDKWLYTEFPNVLKYLVVDKNGSVRVVKNEEEKEKNSVSKDSVDDLENKSDWIEEHILTETAMKEILMRIMRELGLKFYSLPHHENLVMDVIEKYLKKKLRSRMDGSEKKND
jgi:hypothetical protein